MKKLAIFIAGPYRYIDLLIEQLDEILISNNINYDYFIHIWKDDLGDKIRESESHDIKKIREHIKTKVFIYQEPYNAQTYEDSLGDVSGGHSLNHAVIGMFLSMNILCHTLEVLPDVNEYSHILRLRTDIIFLNDLFLDGLKNNEVNVAKNYVIPPNWVSDHIFLAPRKKFFKFWKFKNMKKIIKEYIKAEKNPEKLLMRKKRKNNLKTREFLIRYKDYNIIYNPPREEDPNYIKELINNNGVKFLYKNYIKLNIEEKNNYLLKLIEKNKKGYFSTKYKIISTVEYILGGTITKKIINQIKDKK